MKLFSLNYILPDLILEILIQKIFPRSTA